MANNVINFPDSVSYMVEDSKIFGCSIDGMSFTDEPNGMVHVVADRPMLRPHLKQIMITWLALNYPDVLKFDD